ncbi:uncharacterized protein BXZ73DRAFT_106898 [Epithele typhae]|uniref:uncharacterized protein n=1 Tax=Epithele typhae TaxID=378194 RepID=UPI0020087302|nr:uncharacterized protein BXZ73DRAFT_106898 [Epithele typhae]KAH9913558.1 hypothetical protein BXZ73DRAFT_106898 [Epithele typhae]
MASIFNGRRRQHRPVPVPNEHDPWDMHDHPSTSDDSSSPSSSTPRGAATRIMHHMRRFSANSTPKKREHSPLAHGMYSTAAETLPPSPSPFAVHAHGHAPRPTIEQIAMGLHISRTPHLLPQPRAVSLSPHAHRPHYHHHPSADGTRPGALPLTRPSAQVRRASVSAVVLPPPPARSSMKKTPRPPGPLGASGTRSSENATLATSASDASLSTLTTQTSSVPATPHSALARAGGMPTSFHGKLLRLLPSRKGGGLVAGARADSPAGRTSSDGESASRPLTPRKAVRFSTSTDGRTSHDER